MDKIFFILYGFIKISDDNAFSLIAFKTFCCLLALSKSEVECLDLANFKTVSQSNS